MADLVAGREEETGAFSVPCCPLASQQMLRRHRSPRRRSEGDCQGVRGPAGPGLQLPGRGWPPAGGRARPTPQSIAVSALQAQGHTAGTRCGRMRKPQGDLRALGRQQEPRYLPGRGVQTPRRRRRGRSRALLASHRRCSHARGPSSSSKDPPRTFFSWADLPRSCLHRQQLRWDECPTNGCV